MKKALDWVIKSSANPDKFSATLKNLLPLLVLLGVSQSDAVLLQGAIVSLTVGAGTIITAVGTLAGLYRKIARTLRGENLAV